MGIYSEVHELATQDAETFLADWAALADEGIRCLKNWTAENRVALLVEAPNDYRFRTHGARLKELTELFAPVARWANYDATDLVR
jgi:hypothetical protein